MKKLWSAALAATLSITLLTACQADTETADTDDLETSAASIQTDAGEPTGEDTSSVVRPEPTSAETAIDPQAAQDEAEEINQAIRELTVVKNSDGSVDFVFPEPLVRDVTVEMLMQDDVGGGPPQEAAFNADGSATVSYSKDQHEEMLTVLKENIQLSFAEMKTIITSYQALEANDDLSELTVYVDKDEWTEFDGFGAANFGTFSYFYQLYDGVPAESINYVIRFVDEDTGDTLEAFDSTQEDDVSAPQ